MSRGFAMLQDVIDDPDFPALDLALRRGYHVDRDDGAWYPLLLDAQAQLEAFYRRYGCELIYKQDGYFYLLPSGEQLPRRQLSSTDMLVGQALALLYLDPASVERGGLVAREQVTERLVSALGADALVAALLPKRRRQDERVAQRLVRAKIGEAVRRLAGLGFAELRADEQLRLRPGLLRFAEPVRGLGEPAEALARLVAEGEVSLELGSESAEEGMPDLEGDPDVDASVDAEDDLELALSSAEASALADGDLALDASDQAEDLPEPEDLA